NPLIYTRRIGAPPPAPDPKNDGDQIIQLDPNARILGAAKLTGNLRPGTAIGVLEAYVDGTEAIARAGAGSLSPTYRLQATPPTLFQVLRLRQVVGGASSVGLIETTVARGGGQPDAHVFGADFDVRGQHSDWGANGGAAWSATEACDSERTPA